MWKRLGLKPPVLFDGGLGTELQKLGMPAGKSTITQNLENPRFLWRIHSAYIEAGCQVISANTFGGNIGALRKAGIEELEEQANLQGMRLAKQAAAGLCLTAADIGPTGQFYSREFARQQVEEIYIRQARILLKEPPDLFLLETFFDLREALAAFWGIKRVCGEIPVGVSMTYNKTPRGYFTVMGDKAVDAAAVLQEAGADIIGANCTLTPVEILDLARELKAAIKTPLIIQPNAGQPEISDDEVIYRMKAEDFAEGMAKIAAEGVEFVGGCCGSTPAMMKAVFNRLSSAASGKI